MSLKSKECYVVISTTVQLKVEVRCKHKMFSYNLLYLSLIWKTKRKKALTEEHSNNKPSANPVLSKNRLRLGENKGENKGVTRQATMLEKCCGSNHKIKEQHLPFHVGIYSI